jgi:hypothetical protein
MRHEQHRVVNGNDIEAANPKREEIDEPDEDVEEEEDEPVSPDDEADLEDDTDGTPTR